MDSNIFSSKKYTRETMQDHSLNNIISDLIFEPVSIPDRDDLKKLCEGLKVYNESIVGEYEEKEIASFVKDNQGNIVGGIYGKITVGWLYIDWLWINDKLQHKGIGSKLLKLMEDYAISKNIAYSHLETTSFQALDFYQNNGYEIFGELNNKPPGHISYFLQKQL